MVRADAVGLFITLRTHAAILRRQSDRLQELFQHPPMLSTSTMFFVLGVDALRLDLNNAMLARRSELLSGSADYILVSQAISLLDNSITGLEAEFDPFSAMERGGLLGCPYLDLLHSVSKNGAGDFGELVSRGQVLLSSATLCVGRRFGLEIPRQVFWSGFFLPATVICATSGCDYHSMDFVNLSFIWHWISREDDASLLAMCHAMLNVLARDKLEDLVEHLVGLGRDLDDQDSFGHTFWHAMLLVSRPGHSLVFRYNGWLLPVTKGGKNILHYAAATGTRLDVRLSGGLSI